MGKFDTYIKYWQTKLAKERLNNKEEPNNCINSQ